MFAKIKDITFELLILLVALAVLLVGCPRL